MHCTQLHMQLLSLLECRAWHDLHVRHHTSAHCIAVSIVTHAVQLGPVEDIGALMFSDARAVFIIEVLDTLEVFRAGASSAA